MLLQSPLKRLKTVSEGVTYRGKLLAVVICIPIAVMGAMCDRASITCPPMKKYSQAQQLRMVEQYDHIEELGIAPDLLGFVNDYVDVRDAIKKCIARRK